MREEGEVRKGWFLIVKFYIFLFEDFVVEVVVGSLLKYIILGFVILDVKLWYYSFY